MGVCVNECVCVCAESKLTVGLVGYPSLYTKSAKDKEKKRGQDRALTPTECLLLLRGRQKESNERED